MSALQGLLDRVRADGRVTAADTLEARRAVFPDGKVDRKEVDALFAIDEAAKLRSADWADFFVEALSDHLVRQEKPQGYVSAANANWLIKRIAEDGKVKTQTELELLIRVLEIADKAPPALAAFALDQVRHHVLAGEAPGRVSGSDARRLRRILYAFGGDGAAGITRAEAEVLFDIHDATSTALNDPEWDDLFVKALANLVMVASGYAAPPREIALARENWLENDSGGVLTFFARMAAAGANPKTVLEAYQAPSPREEAAARNADRAAKQARAETVDASEAAWLAQRIKRDGGLSNAETALLRFLRDESPDLHPSLQPLVEAA